MHRVRQKSRVLDSGRLMVDGWMDGWRKSERDANDDDGDAQTNVCRSVRAHRHRCSSRCYCFDGRYQRVLSGSYAAMSLEYVQIALELSNGMRTTMYLILS